MQLSKKILMVISGPLLGVLVGCTPRVEVAAPKEPITINLNVKIDHEVRVRVDRDLDKVISPESDLF
jgi:hypothetical protein